MQNSVFFSLCKRAGGEHENEVVPRRKEAD